MTGEHGGLDILGSATEYLRNDLIRSASMEDQHRPRKRRRAALSCEQCRQRKLKCDRGDPCGACVKSRLPACVYQNNYGTGPLPGNISFGLMPSSQTAAEASHGLPPGPSRLPPTPAFTQSPTSREVEAHHITSHSNKEPTVFDESLRHMNPEPLRGIRGTYIKGQLYGESHWTSYLSTSSIFIEGIRDIAREGFTDAFGLLGKCKALAREVKAQETPDDDQLKRGENLFPSRPVADMLVQAYLRSLETVFRILDVPQFQKLYEQYWQDPESMPSGFQQSLSMVFANGVAVCSNHGISRKTVNHWIYRTSEWLNHPRAKMRLDLWSIRSHCLLLLARQSNGIDSKMTAVSASSLVTTAMYMGLHVDPVHFAESQVPKREREVRRRLWAAVLELELQATMDSGGRPLVREDDYDCAPPSNIDDHEGPTAPSRAAVQPLEQYTHSSLQILLARSTPVRLKIVRFVNDFRQGARYQEALALSKELAEEMRRSQNAIEGWRKSGAPITQFQTEVWNVLLHRFLLALHYSYALKAKDEPLFYFSRKVCLDSSVALLSPPVSQRDPDFYRLVLRGRSAFQDVFTAAANFLSEYISAEKVGNATFIPSPSVSSDNHLIAAIENHVPLSLARVEAGETNAKGHLLYCCLLAHAKAVHGGKDLKAALRNAINASLEDAYAALRTRLNGPSPMLDMGENGMWGEENSMENLFNWLQNDGVLGADDGAWLSGIDWSTNNDSGLGVPPGM